VLSTQPECSSRATSLARVWRTHFGSFMSIRISADPRKPLAWGTGGGWDMTVVREHEHRRFFYLTRSNRAIVIGEVT
jgi:hypothetical protein